MSATLEQKIQQLEDATNSAQSDLTMKQSALTVASNALTKAKTKLKSTLSPEAQQTIQVNDTELPELLSAKMIAQEEYDEAKKRYDTNQRYLLMMKEKLLSENKWTCKYKSKVLVDIIERETPFNTKTEVYVLILEEEEWSWWRWGANLAKDCWMVLRYNIHYLSTNVPISQRSKKTWMLPSDMRIDQSTVKNNCTMHLVYSAYIH